MPGAGHFRRILRPLPASVLLVAGILVAEAGCGRSGFQAGSPSNSSPSPSPTPGLPLLTVIISGTGSVSVSSAPGGIDCTTSTSPCSASFKPGPVQLTATLGSAYLSGWLGCQPNSSSSCSLTIGESSGGTATLQILPPGGVVAAHLFGGPEDDEALGVVALPTSGDAVVTGYFQGANALFGESAFPAVLGSNILLSSNGGKDLFVARYTTAMAVVWAEGFGGPQDDEAVSISRSTAGELAITGDFVSASLAFPPGPPPAPPIPPVAQGNGATDTLFAAGFLSSSGQARWAFGGAKDAGMAITFQNNGQLYIADALQANLGDAQMLFETTAGKVVASWPNGELTLGATAPNNADIPFAVAVDSAGDVYCGGTTFSGGLTIQGSFKTTNPFVTNNQSAGWVGGIQPNGSAFLAVTIDTAGSVVTAVGTLPGTTDIVYGGYAPGVSFLTRVTLEGQTVWSDRWTGEGDQLLAMAVGTDGRIIAAGTITNKLTFGSQTVVSAGGSDLLILRVDHTDGRFKWARAFGGTGNDAATAVAIGPQGFVYVTGYVDGDNPPPGMTGSGENDGVLLRLVP